MNKKTPSLKSLVFILSIVLLLPSCKAYQNKTVSSEDAIITDRGVKIITYENEVYKFKSLQKLDDKLIGITTRKSETANKLVDKIIAGDPNSKYVKILLPDNFVKEIHLERKGNAFKIAGYTGLGLLAAIGAWLIAIIIGL